MSQPAPRRRLVAVTGATGFIGAHLTADLVGSGADVVAVARQRGWRPPFAESTDGVQLVALDPLAADPRQLEAALAGVDGVVHLAYAPTPPGSNPAVHEVERNLAGTVRLLDALPDTVHHLVFASSVMVYGPTAGTPVTVTADLRPSSPYGTAKLSAEHFLRTWAQGRQVSVSVLRLSTVYGPMETVPRAVPNFIRAALAGRAPVIRGPGTEVRDYVHVRDVVRAVGAALGRSGGYEVVNVGSGLGHSTAEVARRVLRLTGSRVPAEHLPGDAQQTSMVCDLSCAQRVLDYRPTVGFDEGLADEIAWFADNPDRWS